MEIFMQNNEIPQFLVEAATKSYEQTDLVIFIGAGFSKMMGLPGWEDYARLKLSKLISTGKIELDYATKDYYLSIAKNNPKLLLSLLHSELTRQNANLANSRKSNIDISFIEKEIFKLSDEQVSLLKREFQPFITAMKKINAFYITTNYDNVLEEVFGFEKYVYTGEKVITQKRQVWHIHGDINNANLEIISSNQDYFKMYYQEKVDYYTKVRVGLREVFTKKNMLFVGYGLGEMELLQYLFDKSEIVNPTEFRHAIIETLYSNTSSELLKNYYADLGIQLITLNKDKKGYHIIHDVLIEWAEKLEMKSKDIIQMELL
jgi:NAD-dependent SIR2 family protein deacetylase